MISAVSQWIRQIVMVVMFAAFVDFLIPEHNFLRYVKVFLGLLVMITIINPLIPLFHNGLTFDEIPIIYEDYVENQSIASMSEILNEKNSEIAITEYKSNLEKYLFEKITELTSYNVKNIAVEVDEDLSSKNFGKIKQISIALRKRISEDKSFKEKISIEKIKIGDNPSESSDFIENPNREFKEIINYLTSTFDISENNIYMSLED